MFTLFYHHGVREIIVLYSNKRKVMENEKGAELSVIELQSLISNDVVQWLLISFRT